MFLQKEFFLPFYLALLLELMLKVDDKSTQHDTQQNVFGIPPFAHILSRVILPLPTLPATSNTTKTWKI